MLHPRCSIVAYSGPIVIGSNCIIEETAIIVNRTKGVMIIGDDNHFQVGCREFPTSRSTLGSQPCSQMIVLTKSIAQASNPHKSATATSSTLAVGLPLWSQSATTAVSAQAASFYPVPSHHQYQLHH